MESSEPSKRRDLMSKTKSVAWICVAVVLAIQSGCRSHQSRSTSLVVAIERQPAAVETAVQTKESQAAMTPQAALALLREGNARFVAGRSKARNLPAEVRATASGQYPFAVVLCCLDSR